MRKYDHLFFDLDNTLWDFDSNSKLALFATLNDFNIDQTLISYDEFYKSYKKINESLWEAYRNQKIRKPELIRTRFEQVLDQFKIENVDPIHMNNQYLNHMPKQNILIEGVPETLEYLKKKGYQMHIITNGFKEVQLKKLSNSMLNNYFDGIFISEEVEAPKPDKRIFQHALKNCNAKKSKSIMIGDSWDADIIGACKFGIDQVYFQHNHENKISEKFKPTNSFQIKIQASVSTFRITHLPDLNEIL